MGQAGKALREVLTTYGISQNKLATAMGLQRSAVYKWLHQERSHRPYGCRDSQSLESDELRSRRSVY